jgi:predicted restriction endonuclease
MLGRYEPGSKDAQWRSIVKSNADYTCFICASRHSPYKLHAHHIESYADNPTLRRTIKNGVCLCSKCHMKFHTKYGFGENTRIQFEEFVKSYKKGNTYKPKTYKPKKIKSVKYAKPKSTNNN